MAHPTYLPSLSETFSRGCHQASAAQESGQVFQQALRALDRQERREQPGLCHPLVLPDSQVTVNCEYC